MGLLESRDKRFPSVSLPVECQDSKWKALLAHKQMLQCLSEQFGRIFRDHPRLLKGFVSRSSCALLLLQAASFPSNIHSAVVRDEAGKGRHALQSIASLHSCRLGEQVLSLHHVDKPQDSGYPPLCFPLQFWTNTALFFIKGAQLNKRFLGYKSNEKVQIYYLPVDDMAMVTVKSYPSHNLHD